MPSPEIIAEINKAWDKLKRPPMWKSRTDIVLNLRDGTQVELTFEEARNTADAILILLSRSP